MFHDFKDRVTKGVDIMEVDCGVAETLCKDQKVKPTTNSISSFNCSRTKFQAIIVNLMVFFMQNFRLTVLTFQVKTVNRFLVSAAELKWRHFTTKSHMKCAETVVFFNCS